MSLQSMYNSMIGNIGVQASILKHRLASPEEKEAEIKKPPETAKKAPKSASKEKTVNDTTEPEKRQEKAVKTATAASVKEKQDKSLMRYQKRVSTLKNQISELEIRRKELEKIMDTSYGGAL